MASLIHSNLIFLLLIVFYPLNILSQAPSSSSPTLAPCTSSLLPLFPCTPFVQGAVNAPSADCCSNFEQLYSREPHCLCSLLNDTTFNSFPINKTLAFQIPSLCHLQVNNSTCPGEKINVTPSSPNSQVSFGTKNNATVAASPLFSVPPRPSMIGFGFAKSETINLKAKNGVVVVMNITIFMFMLVF